MSDPFVIMDAQREGYEVLTINGKAYYRPQQKINGPYSSLEEAAKAAINESRKLRIEKLETEYENEHKRKLLG